MRCEVSRGVGCEMSFALKKKVSAMEKELSQAYGAQAWADEALKNTSRAKLHQLQTIFKKKR